MTDLSTREWLTTSQACEYLGVCRNTLLNMRKRRTIAASLAAGPPRYRRSALDRAMERRERSGR